MYKIKMITDSASDIPREMAEQWGIEVLSIPIAIDDRAYREREDFSPQEFYKILENSPKIPVTSHITAVEFLEQYRKYYKMDYTDIVLVTINSAGSNMFDAATLARNLFYEEEPDAREKVNIHIIDSKCYTVAYGLAVVQAAKMAAEGKEPSEVTGYLLDAFERAETYFSVFTLDFAKKSGRISCAAAFVGDVLGLRPVMRIMDKEIKIIDKVRGDKNVVPRMVKEVKVRTKKRKPEYAVIRGVDEAPALELEKQLKKELGYPPVGIFYAGASIAINAGPKLVGVCFLGEKRS